MPTKFEFILDDNHKAVLSFDKFTKISKKGSSLNMKFSIACSREITKDEVKLISEKAARVQEEMKDIFYFGSVIRK